MKEIFNRIDDLPDEDFSNYGTGGYYGNTFQQNRHASQRNQQNRSLPASGTPDNYRNLGDRRWNFKNAQPEHLRRSGYRSDEERFRRIHRGKGSRHYTRPDYRIAEDINERLYEDPFVDASNVEVLVTQGDVTISGTVENKYFKRRAEEISEAVSGVKNIVNKIRVIDHY